MRLRLATPLSFTLSITLLLAAGGCTHYRYDVVPALGPPDATPTTIRKDQDLVLPAAPARLRLRQVESRCVLLVENPTDTEISLDGNASAVVDPLGQSRAIASQLLPPGAFMKLILPPLRDAPPGGPAFQFGVGVLVQGDDPRPAQYLDVGRAQDYWEWNGDGRVRVVLTLRQKDQSFRHELVLLRTKQ